MEQKFNVKDIVIGVVLVIVMSWLIEAFLVHYFQMDKYWLKLLLPSIFTIPVGYIIGKRAIARAKKAKEPYIPTMWQVSTSPTFEDVDQDELKLRSMREHIEDVEKIHAKFGYPSSEPPSRHDISRRKIPRYLDDCESQELYDPPHPEVAVVTAMAVGAALLHEDEMETTHKPDTPELDTPSGSESDLDTSYSEE